MRRRDPASQRLDGESGWDVFMLTYFVSTPLTSVITQPQLETYGRLFRFLWALRGVDYGLKDLWKQRLALNLASLVEMRRVWHAVSVLQSEMTHLLNELQYYVVFEVDDPGVWPRILPNARTDTDAATPPRATPATAVSLSWPTQVIECSWNELQDALKDKVHDFDALIAAHGSYVASLAARAFLDVASKVRRRLSGCAASWSAASGPLIGAAGWARLKWAGAPPQELHAKINGLLEHTRQFIVTQVRRRGRMRLRPCHTRTSHAR